VWMMSSGAAARPCSVKILHAIYENKRGPRDGDPQGARRREVVHCRYSLELCDQVFIPTSAAAIKLDGRTFAAGNA
jgi:hypothetical protein